MNRIKLPQIQGHYLTLALKDSILTLEIEEESSGRTFSLDLDEDSIDQVTDGLFQTAEDLFRGLQDGANSRCPGITLSILKGKLIYTVVFSTETVQKYSFILNLTEKRLDQMDILGRKLQLLEQWKERSEADNEEKFERVENNVMKTEQNMVNVENFQAFQTKSDQRFDKLEKMMLQMEQKMAQRLEKLDRLYEDLKESLILKLKAYFDHNSANVSGYILSDSNKTASRKGLPGWSFPCLELLPQVPSSGKCAYSLRINKVVRAFGFGITSETGKGNWNLNRYFCYSTASGKIYGIGENDPDGKSPFGGNGQTLKMVVDMEQGTLSFLLDNRLVNSCTISKSDNYFAFVTLRDVGDSVTVI